MIPNLRTLFPERETLPQITRATARLWTIKPERRTLPQPPTVTRATARLRLARKIMGPPVTPKVPTVSVSFALRGRSAHLLQGLDPSVIAKGFQQNGQGNQADPGQVASLTSTNNFINFCVGQTLTNGQQVKTGSCNPAPMGNIPANTKMPSSKFTNPKNLDVLKSNTTFTVSMAIQNLITGNFVNAAQNYFAAPQQLNAQGIITGHSHVVIQQMESLTSTKVLDPATFAFFKGLNAAAQGGILSADVPGGLGPGTYRLASINTAANHQPALVPVAQHGSLDDVVYVSHSPLLKCQINF